jgi:hypothetical protein
LKRKGELPPEVPQPPAAVSSTPLAGILKGNRKRDCEEALEPHEYWLSGKQTGNGAALMGDIFKGRRAFFHSGIVKIPSQKSANNCSKRDIAMSGFGQK